MPQSKTSMKADNGSITSPAEEQLPRPSIPIVSHPAYNLTRHMADNGHTPLAYRQPTRIADRVDLMRDIIAGIETQING
ncbi:hypothetical protein B7494_g1947 [Chlorociboria aeruginascens]|nr:hypothetical protein B7494_g1947 [Chlorociboria aeruginascens]